MAAAHRAFPAWAARTPQERAALLMAALAPLEADRAAMAAESLTRVALELGGNDPAIVLADVDLGPEAMQRLFSGAFDSTGQICMATKRLYVHRSRYSEVVEGLSEILAATRLGHGLDGVTMGPLHSDRQLSYVQELVAQARESGPPRWPPGCGPATRSSTPTAPRTSTGGAPFGGFDHSCMGREMGIEGVREFMGTHAVGFPA